MSRSYDDYAARRMLWERCLTGDDVHSIWPQVWSGTWNIAAYRVVMKAIELAPSDPDGGHQLNGMVFNLFHNTVFEAECLRIRRLTEVEPHGLDKGDRSVFSLGTLLKDLEDHARLLTPENLLQTESDKGSDDWWVGQRQRHCQTLVCYTGRQHAHIPSELFKDLRNSLSVKADRVKSYADKYIAHSASPESRQSASATGPSFAELVDTLRLIAETADFLSVYVLSGASHGKLPIATHDQFVYLDRSLAPDDETLQQLQQRWTETQEQVEGWNTDLALVLEGLSSSQED